MPHTVAEKHQVFLAYRPLIFGINSKTRQTKAIENLVERFKSSTIQLIEDLGHQKTVEILKELLKHRVFESDTRAKAALPELFKVSPVRSVQRAASVNEVARSEVEALEELASDVKFGVQDKNKGQEDLPKQGSIKVEELLQPMVVVLSKSQEPIVPSLYPESIPFNVQHLILTTTQDVLENCCFDFAVKWVPALLESKGWSCPEAAELTLWTQTLAKLCDELPTDAIFNESGIPLATIFNSTTSIRHTAVHRLPTSADGIQKMMLSAIQLAMTLGDATRSASLELVKANFDARIKDMELNKNFLENKLDDQLELIREQRAELDRKEKEAIATMIREDLENKLIVSSNLEASVREAFGLDMGWGVQMKRGGGILPVSDRKGKGKTNMERIRESSEREDSDYEVDVCGPSGSLSS